MKVLLVVLIVLLAAGSVSADSEQWADDSINFWIQVMDSNGLDCALDSLVIAVINNKDTIEKAPVKSVMTFTNDTTSIAINGAGSCKIRRRGLTQGTPFNTERDTLLYFGVAAKSSLVADLTKFGTYRLIWKAYSNDAKAKIWTSGVKEFVVGGVESRLSESEPPPA